MAVNVVVHVQIGHCSSRNVGSATATLPALCSVGETPPSPTDQPCLPDLSLEALFLSPHSLSLHAPAPYLTNIVKNRI